MPKTTASVNTAEELEDYLKQIISHCKEKDLDIKQVLNKKNKYLQEEIFAHYVINAYSSTENSKEKAKLCELLRTLLNLGADPNIWDKNERSPLLHRAIKLHSLELVKVIISSILVDYNKDQHELHLTPLEVCLKHWPEKIDLIKFLSEKNNHELQNIFIEAINDKDKARIIFFIQNNLVNFNMPDSEGRLPLHLLCIQGNTKLINLVLGELKKIGQPIDFAKTDIKGNSALHYACHPWSNPELNIVDWLLKNKIDPNQPNQHGDYPLHLAIETDNPELVTLLVKYGADKEKPDRQGRLPVMKLIMRPDIIHNPNMLSQL